MFFFLTLYVTFTEAFIIIYWIISSFPWKYVELLKDHVTDMLLSYSTLVHSHSNLHSLHLLHPDGSDDPRLSSGETKTFILCYLHLCWVALEGKGQQHTPDNTCKIMEGYFVTATNYLVQLLLYVKLITDLFMGCKVSVSTSVLVPKLHFHISLVMGCRECKGHSLRLCSN